MLKAGSGQGHIHIVILTKNKPRTIGLFFHTFEDRDILNLRLLMIIIMQLEHKQLSYGMNWIRIFDLLIAFAARKDSNIPTYFRISETFKSTVVFIHFTKKYFFIPCNSGGEILLTKYQDSAESSGVWYLLWACFQAKFSLVLER